MHSRTKLAKTRLAAAAVVTVAALAASPWILGQSCPATGCAIPGITVPNGLTICSGTGTNVHDSTQFHKGNQLCNPQAIDPANWVYGPEHDLTPAQQVAPFWNVVATKMAAGLPVIGRRWSAPDGSDYCSVAPYVDSGPNANHFTWADQRHAARAGCYVVPLLGCLGQGVEDGVEQLTRATAVQRTHRKRLAEAERPQPGGVGFRALVVDFVRGQQHPLAGAL